MKTRKLLSVILALVMLISIIAGCGQNAPTSSSQPSQSIDPVDESKPYAGTTLRFVTANQPCVETTIQENLPEFEELTGIKVEMEVLGTDQFTNKVSVELSGKSNSLDVYFLRPLNDLKQFTMNGWLEDLTPYFANDEDYDLDDFFEASLGSCTNEGKLLGIPLVAESQIVYYRKDIFEQNGITEFPQTMEEFLEVAKKLTDKENDFYGFVGRGKSNQVVTQFSTYLRAFGGDFNTATESLINTPEALEAYKFYGELLRECAPDGAVNMNWPEAAALFAQGKAAMFADSDAIYANVTETDNSAVAEVTGFEIMPAGPAGRKPFYAVIGGLSISPFSQNKEAAVEFIKWATSKEMDVKMAQQVKNPGCRASTWDNSEATKDWPTDLMDAMIRSREVAVAGDRPTVINVVQARDIISVPIIEAIMGNDPVKAAESAHKEFQALIDNENGGN